MHLRGSRAGRRVPCFDSVHDLNDFYPSSHLPRLYPARNNKGDESLAQTALHVTKAACQRALACAAEDGWVRPTLFGLAFDIPDTDQAEELAEIIAAEGADRWELTTMLNSLEESRLHVKDDAVRERIMTALNSVKLLSGD